MKNILFLAIAMFVLAPASFACDICGCSVSNYNPFLFPQLSKTFVNVSYLNRVYYTHKGDFNSSKQHLNSFIVTGQYSITKKLQLTAMVPYHFNQLQNATKAQDVSGLGDISLLVNYKLWEKLTPVVRQTFTAGAGIKLPSGNYSTANGTGLEEQNFQLGTGSTDYILNGSYLANFSKIMLNAAATYKYNTQNSNGFRFGDVLTTSATAVYRKEVGSISVSPYLQATNEAQLKDASKNTIIDASGGHALYGGGGIDVNTKRFATGVNWQAPVSQNLGQGAITVKPRFSAHLSITL